MNENTEPIHPGRILLLQAMKPLGISQDQLARDIGVPVGRISEITNGQRGITADTALRFGRYFGTGPQLWQRLQAEYDLSMARISTWPAVESSVRVLNVPAIGDISSTLIQNLTGSEKISYDDLTLSSKPPASEIAVVEEAEGVAVMSFLDISEDQAELEEVGSIQSVELGDANAITEDSSKDELDIPPFPGRPTFILTG